MMDQTRMNPGHPESISSHVLLNTNRGTVSDIDIQTGPTGHHTIHPNSNWTNHHTILPKWPCLVSSFCCLACQCDFCLILRQMDIKHFSDFTRFCDNFGFLLVKNVFTMYHSPCIKSKNYILIHIRVLLVLCCEY